MLQIVFLFIFSSKDNYNPVPVFQLLQTKDLVLEQNQQAEQNRMKKKNHTVNCKYAFFVYLLSTCK